MREREHLENLGVNMRIILKRMFRNSNGGMYWIDLAQNRDGWRVVVNTVMNLWIPLTPWSRVLLEKLTSKLCS